LALTLAALALATPAAAQTAAPDAFQPALEDWRHPQRFARPKPAQPSSTPGLTPPAAETYGNPPAAGAGGTGFNSTGAIGRKKATKTNAGVTGVKKLTPITTLIREPPQIGHATAPQTTARKLYSDAYRAPDLPPTLRRPPIPQQDAFEPTGIKVGEFMLRPAIEITRGHDSNPAHVPGGSGSDFTLVAPELQARSLWSRHELAVSLRGSYSSYDSQSSLNRPSLDSKITGRIDVSRDTKIELENRVIVGTDYPGSPNVTAGLAKLPVYSTIGGSIGFAQSFNHLTLSARANVDRTVFQESELTDGATFSNEDRNLNQYSGQVRASYELKPGIRPFVELGADQRIHDLAIDRNGEQRDSKALTPKIGTSFELTRSLTGEVSVGYLMRRYQDPGLQPLNGVVADAALIWAATGLTTATLTASSRAEESILPGVSGALRRDGNLQIDHAFRRWLIGTFKVGYGFDQYVGLGREDKRTSLGFALTYKVNREIQLKGEVRQDWLRSNVTGVDYDATAFLFGVRLQR
jgi:hypothetical protein